MNRIAVTACVALGTVGVLSAALSGAHAGGTSTTSPEQERDLILTLVTPTVDQEVLPDMSDPGLNGVVTVRFSSILNPGDLLDDQNVVNRLSPKVEALDALFSRLPGTPSVRRNIFTFAPLSVATPTLAQGQYTFNFKSSIRNTRGKLLNNGVFDSTTTFTVGTDVFPPVLRKITPINGQTGIGLLDKITATFNEPIDFPSALTNVTVQDASTNPPTAIPGAGGGTGITVTRGGFDVNFTPDPCFGYPPKTPIQCIIQGVGFNFTTNPPTQLNTNAMTDILQNKFRRDPGLQWTADAVIQHQFNSPNGTYDETNGQFRMRFTTKGVKPPPQGLRPGGSMMNFGPPFTAPCSQPFWQTPSCFVSGNMEIYTTDSGLGEIDLRGFISRFNQGVEDFALISLLPNSPVRLGRPAGMVYDPRVIGPGNGANSFHTFFYVVDERSGTVLIVRSDNFKVIGRFTGFSSPRDVSVSTDTSQARTTLYVSDFGANQLVAIDLEGIRVSFVGQPGAPSPCQLIKDNQSTRAYIPVGAGPTDVSADCFLQQRVMVCNTLANSMTVIDVKTNKVLKTYTVGTNPVSCDWITYQFGLVRMAIIANQGGLADPDGSASFYFYSAPLNGGFVGANATRDSIESTLTDSVKNPTNVFGNQKWVNGQVISIPSNWFLSNTGSDTVLNLTYNIIGSAFGLDIVPGIVGKFQVGPNPSSAIWDGFYPTFACFASVTGTGQVVGFDPLRSVPPLGILVPGVRRLFNAFTN